MKTSLAERAYRAMSPPAKTAERGRLLDLKLRDKERERLTKDTTRVIPQLMDILDGLLADPDDLLLKDVDGYDKIFNDDQIAASLDNAFLPVSQATWGFKAADDDQMALVPFLTRHAIEVAGFGELILDLCYAEVEGIRISRTVYENVRSLREPLFEVREFVPKDKRRFRPGDPE